VQKIAMNKEHGGISVTTEHIFPIIKRWLYSEKEIFIREIVSNASDAVVKLKRLVSLGHVRSEDVGSDFRIDVKLDKAAKTITVSDNGIGMNADEVKNYICQIALSGALDFIQKYEGETDENNPGNTVTSGNGIIGHFGLGFYSAFMVSESVDVITRSFDGSPAVKWTCGEDGEYEMSDADKEGRGTDVVMHVSDEEAEFLDTAKLKDALMKYCSFMPIEIYYHDCEKHEHDHDDHDCEECATPINDVHPLWQKNSSDCTDEEYKAFYGKVFTDYREPLFHIHLRADYPLNFAGILYFPRIRHEYENLEGQVKLYYNQVFVADNIKEVIPEYLLMLRGVLDCPELPLNVSRSYLQNSGYVTKISAHITKKVGDKINSLFTLERENYEKMWDDIKLFVEYGCVRDRKFYDRVKDSVLYKLTDGKYVNIAECTAASDTVYYTNDKVSQAQYIDMFVSQGINVVILDKVIDSQYISLVENDKKLKFKRVDAEVDSSLIADGEVYENEQLADLFKKIGGEKLTVKFENLKDAGIPCVLTLSEESRRFSDMMKLYAMNKEDKTDAASAAPTDATMILNANSPLIRKLGDSLSEEIARQVYSLALISQRQLTAEELKSFLSGSYKLLEDM
jgi:molecular chaperone HtpG